MGNVRLFFSNSYGGHVYGLPFSSQNKSHEMDKIEQKAKELVDKFLARMPTFMLKGAALANIVKYLLEELEKQKSDG